MKVWLDGELHDGPSARVPVTDHGLLYGDGVFEGIRVHAGRVFRLGDHLARLARSGAAIGLALPDAQRLGDVVLATARAEGVPDVYIRLIVTRGDGPLGVDPGRCPSPRVICIADRLEIYDPDLERRGLVLVTVGVRRDPDAAVDPRVKSLNYLPSVLAKAEARAAGADDALLLNTRGQVAEAAVANVFQIRGGRVSTPPHTDGALPGITRDTLLSAARELGLDSAERSIDPQELATADEVLLAGTGVGIVGVRAIDDRPIGSGEPGPVTQKLALAYRERVRREGTPIQAR